MENIFYRFATIEFEGGCFMYLCGLILFIVVAINIAKEKNMGSVATPAICFLATIIALFFSLLENLS